jgi:SAM-dependent methyltransferase
MEVPLNESKQSNKTIDFYNSHAKQYIAETVNIDISNLRNHFLELIPKGCHILDLGCGSGRDSRFFLDHGYSVTAIDASYELAILASEYIGQTVKNLSFQELDYMEEFFGIWACASLLHCPKAEMSTVMQRMNMALKPDGIIYMSFKYGTDERIDERGRFFNNYTETDMSKMLLDHSDFYIVELFTESKPLRSGIQNWLNVIVKKQVK